MLHVGECSRANLRYRQTDRQGWVLSQAHLSENVGKYPINGAFWTHSHNTMPLGDTTINCDKLMLRNPPAKASGHLLKELSICLRPLTGDWPQAEKEGKEKGKNDELLSTTVPSWTQSLIVTAKCFPQSAWESFSLCASCVPFLRSHLHFNNSPTGI